MVKQPIIEIILKMKRSIGCSTKSVPHFRAAGGEGILLIECAVSAGHPMNRMPEAITASFYESIAI